MAKYYWGLNFGQQEFDTVKQTSDPSKDVEVVVNTTNAAADFASTGQAKMAVIEKLEQLKNSIVKGNWPPA